MGRHLRILVIVEGNVHWPNQGIYKIEKLQASDENQKTLLTIASWIGEQKFQRTS